MSNKEDNKPLDSSLRPAWERINSLFAKHGLLPPPTRLRDELVMHLLAYEKDQS